LIAGATIPQFLEQELEQRQVARLVSDVAQDLVDKAGLERQPRLGGRLFDDAAELVPQHRAHVHDRILKPIGEDPVLQRASVEVAAQRQHDREALAVHAGQQHAQEIIALLIALDVLRLGIKLLPLVDDEQQPIGSVLLAELGLNHIGQRDLAGSELLSPIFQQCDAGEFVQARVGRKKRGGKLPQRILTRTHEPISHTRPSARRRNAGTSPANTTELLPEPDAPTTPMSDRWPTLSISTRVNASRPTKKASSSSRNGSSPRNGHSSARGSGRPISAASGAWP